MSRFSIQTQILILSGAFIIVLFGSSAVSWMKQNSLFLKMQEKQVIILQDILMGSVLEDALEAEIAMYRFANGIDAALPQINSNLAEIAVELEAFKTVIKELGAADHGSAVLVVDIEAAANSLQPLIARLPEFEALELFDRKVTIDREAAPVLQEFTTLIDAKQDALEQRIGNSVTDSAQSIVSANQSLLISTITVTIISLGLAIFFGRLFSRPIKAAAGTVTRLAQREYDLAIPGRDRGDEIGQIAVNLDALRETLEAADAQTEREKLVAERRTKLFGVLGERMQQLSGGDMQASIAVNEWSDLGETYVDLCDNFNTLSGSLGDLVNSIRDSASMVEQNANDLSNMSNDMSRRAETQAATLEQSAAALEELSESVRSAAARAAEADDKVGATREQAKQGGEVMGRALQAMSSIANSSDQITQIIGVIDDIAFQTNLLALNAGVEAARAGESGKGFSVVASEVRSLAQRASESAKEIKALVSNSSQQVKDGGRLVEETGATLTAIVESVTNVSNLVSEIASAAKEQASGLQEINTGVSELDKATQQNAAMVNETSGASKQLTSEAARLSEQISKFGDASSGAAMHRSVEGGAFATMDSDWIEDAVKTAPAKPAPSVPPAKAVVNSDDDLWAEF